MWTDMEKKQSSTWRELKAIESCLDTLKTKLESKIVKWFTDNQNCVRIIQCGSRKQELHSLAMSIFSICLHRSISIDIQWIPRNLNTEADSISKIFDFDDWGVSLEKLRNLIQNILLLALQVWMLLLSIGNQKTIEKFKENYTEIEVIFRKRLLKTWNEETKRNRPNHLTLSYEFEALKKENALLRHSPIAFVAELTKTITGVNQQIHFDHVKLNLGNSYYLSHGNFIVPVNGLYLFTITACSHTNHYVVLELTVNTAVVGKVLAGDTAYNECSSRTFLQQLSSGDDVFVQHKTTGDYLLSYAGHGLPSFSGVLLNAFLF
ncbi:Hypothetical predicted protein [Mytilus galloprovincialis]|uniref:C1q domain-containing protein n=1 Tax=Mytilus galloprovincialis TaxID=29158 RepID=A0A8B6H2P7_MYTGA|nr:Hypothetical predicted protein [Mytilus galloprovincialis]